MAKNKDTNKSGERIGLLGGSFNPAHHAHLAMSRYALDHLKLDAVWWMVALQNPLKGQHGMAPYADRLAGARAIAAGEPRVTVSDFEQQTGTNYTIDMLRALMGTNPGKQFIWLMGADNMLQMDQWKDWQEIFSLIPIAVLRRPPYSAMVETARAAHTFGRYRLPDQDAALLAGAKLPAWALCDNPEHALSATVIREGTAAGK